MFSDAPVDEPTTLTGVSAWPGVECSYRFGGTGTQPSLTVTVSSRPERSMPGPDEPPQPAAQPAREQAEQYRLIGGQLDAAGVSVSLLSTLEKDLAMPVADGALSLRRFARAAELFAGAAAAATAPKLAGLATLGELLERYGLFAEHLATAHADRPLNGLLAAGQDLARLLGQGATETVPTDASTLAVVAGRLNTTAGRLLAGNRGLRLADEPSVVLPGRVTLPMDARIPYSVRGGDTLAVLARRFGCTPRDLVAGNADVPGTLPVGLGVEVTLEASEVSPEPGTEASTEPDAQTSPADAGEAVIVATVTVAGDSFGSLHVRLAEQHPGVALELVADALDRLGATLNPGPVLSCPLAVLGTGTSDRPVTAAEVQAEYGCPPEAFGAANAAMLDLLQPGIRLEWDGAATITTQHDTLHAVLERLTFKGIRPTVDRLLAEHARVPLFRAGSRALLPPTPVTLTARPGRALDLAALATALVVTLRLERLANATVTGDVAARADTPVPPDSDQDALVDACLTALPDLRLAADPDGVLWAVSFGSAGISSVRIEATAPTAFGLRPLYRRLVEVSTSIRPVTARGELGSPTLREYRGLDVEPWARSFLADLDGYLAEPLASRLPDAAREQLAGFHRSLSDAIADGLAPLVQDQTAVSNVDRARSVLASIARTGLSGGYRVSLVAQYRVVAVASSGPDGKPSARLVGSLQDRPYLDLSRSRIELAVAGATCTFAVTSADPASATVTVQPKQIFDGLEISGAGDPKLLRFLRPLQGSSHVAAIESDLPAAHLPVALREHPQPVSATGLTAEASFAGPGLPSLDEAARWTAGLSYLHSHGAHDTVRLTLPRPPRTRSGSAGTALAEALIGYSAASAELATLIGSDVEPPDGLDAATLRANAAASLITLAAAMTSAWCGHWADQVAATSNPELTETHHQDDGIDAVGVTGLTGDYRLRAVSIPGSGLEGRQLLDRLLVTRTGTESAWPVITVAAQDDRFLLLTPGPLAGDTREYVAAGQPAVLGPLRVRLEWPGLRGIPAPDDRITLTTERNAELGGAPTAPEFVLTARPVEVAVPSPSLHWSEEVLLTGDSLAQALQSTFDTLLGRQPTGQLSIEADYLEPVGELSAVLPVLLIPRLSVGPDTAAELATELAAWQRAYQPASSPGAAWQLRLRVLSPRDGEPPLVTFDRLVFPVLAS